MGLSKADADRMIIGVLALQGSFREHCNHLRKAGADAKEVCETNEQKKDDANSSFTRSKALVLVQQNKEREREKERKRPY